MSITDSGTNFGYIFYNNQSEKTLEEELQFTELEGLELMFPYEGRSAKVSVPAGERRIILLRRVGNKSSFNFNQRTTFSERVDTLLTHIK